MLSIFTFYGSAALLVLRLAVGIVLVAHGWQKMKDPKGTAEWFDSIGFKPGRLFATLAMLLEFFGGLALIAGLLVQVVSFFLILQFVVILVWRFSKKSPLVGGYEIDLLILGGAAVLFILGGGAPGLDRILSLGV